MWDRHPRCAASATWNPHVDVKGLEDAAGTGLWQCRRVEVEGAGKGDKRNGIPYSPYVEVYLAWQWDMAPV